MSRNNNANALKMIQARRQQRLNGSLTKRLKTQPDKAKAKSEAAMDKLNDGKLVAGSEIAAEKLVAKIMKKPSKAVAELVSEKPSKPRSKKTSTGSLMDKIKGSKKKTNKVTKEGAELTSDFLEGVTKARKRNPSTTADKERALVDIRNDSIDPSTMAGVSQPRI